MVKLHLRSFQKKAYIDATDAVVFTDAVKMLDAVIPNGGTLSYETPGTDYNNRFRPIQLQLRHYSQAVTITS